MIPKEIREILREYKFKPRKNLGQNFLFDGRLLDKIVDAAGLSDNATALEIGSGTGSLTGRIAGKCKKVVTVEIDRTLCDITRRRAARYGNVKVVEGDILKVNLKDLIGEDKGIIVLANLPYYITTPIIIWLLEEREAIRRIVVTVQEEVAQRIVAKPGSKDYGALSVAVQFYCKAETLFTISRKAFTPRPHVDSALIRMDILTQPPVSVPDENLFFRVVRASFGKRRKMLCNALSSGLGLDKKRASSILEEAGVDPRRRGETLSIEEFAKITRVLHHR